MKAKICDCYSCAYSKNNEHETRLRLKGSFIGGIAYLDINGCIDGKVDLCDDCINDLFNYISSHKKNEVVK